MSTLATSPAALSPLAPLAPLAAWPHPIPAAPGHRAPDGDATHDAARDSAHAAILDDARRLLADAERLLADGAAALAMACLVPGLRQVRDALGADAWERFVRDECLPHPAADRLREDPFIRRCHAKPRGYAGDAVMLDLIYGTAPVPAATTPLGRALFAVNRDALACQSVRERRAILARAIDDAGARATGAGRGARVLSLACGHLREAQCSAAVRDGAVAAFHAVDQDALSIALLHREHAALGVTPQVGSVGDVLRGTLAFAGLDLAYAAGLYDYLPDALAVRLTRRLFGMLSPGGRLIVANFCPELPDIGVMEGVMDWRLIYRDEAQVAALAAAVPPDAVAARRVWRDRVGTVAYLELERA